jgi:hypothetical protein
MPCGEAAEARGAAKARVVDAGHQIPFTSGTR